MVRTITGHPALSARWARLSPIAHRRVGYSWNHRGIPRAAIASSIEVVATVDKICRWFPALAALATAISPSEWNARLLPVGAITIGLA